METKDILDIRVRDFFYGNMDDLPLPPHRRQHPCVRALNGLRYLYKRHNGVDVAFDDLYVRDILRWRRRDLMNTRDMGVKSVAFLEGVLALYGLHFDATEDDMIAWGDAVSEGLDILTRKLCTYMTTNNKKVLIINGLKIERQ